MKSFIASVVTQSKERLTLGFVAFSFALIGSAVGFSAGAMFGTPAPPPITIVNASGSISDPLPSAVDPSLLTSTIGRLHAEILTLRTLYKRLADDAGLDPKVFGLDDALVSPIHTESSESVDDEQASADIGTLLGQYDEQVAHIVERSEQLKVWYRMRAQHRVFDLSSPVLMQGHLSSRFGLRRRPGTSIPKMHRGVDFSAEVGEPVLALADGVVSFSEKSGAYGYMVELLHVNGLLSRYAHNDSNLVRVGQRVEQGEIIAKLGSTGRSTGPHVHVEVHLDGEPVDPMLFMQ